MSVNNFYQISISGSDYSLVNGPMPLPINLYQTSNFDALCSANKDLITGLGWMSHPEIGFWSGIEANAKPDYDFTQDLNITQDLVPESGAVKLTYYLTQKPDADISGSVLSWKDEIRVTRDEYLQLTDFTQLSDAPISTGLKEEYRVFREELRDMFDAVGPTGTGLVWPEMPTGATNIDLQPLPPFPPLT